MALPRFTELAGAARLAGGSQVALDVAFPVVSAVVSAVAEDGDAAGWVGSAPAVCGSRL